MLPPSAGYVSGSCPGPLERAEKPSHAKAALSVSLGFGGNNSCAAIYVGNLEAGGIFEENAHEPISEGGIFIYGAGASRANAGFDTLPEPGEIALVDEILFCRTFPSSKNASGQNFKNVYLGVSRSCFTSKSFRIWGFCLRQLLDRPWNGVRDFQVFGKLYGFRRAFADGFYKFRAQCAAVGDSGYFKCFAYNCASTAKEYLLRRL